MTTFFTLELIDEPNPAGLFLKAWSMELGFTQTQLAKALGVKQSAIAGHFSREGQPPSFATPLGGDLTEMLLDEERRQWPGRWSAGAAFGPRRYPPTRPRVLRQALFVLSHWNRRARSAKPEEMRNLEFRELMSMASPEVVKEMVQMLHIPFYGALIEKPEGYDRRKVVSEREGYDAEFLDRFGGVLHQSRQAMGELIYHAETRFAGQEAARVRRLLASLPEGATVEMVRRKMTVAERAEEDADDPGFLYDAQLIAWVRAGETGKVLSRIAERYDGWQNWKTEQDEAAWRASLELDRIAAAAAGETRH